MRRVSGELKSWDSQWNILCSKCSGHLRARTADIRNFKTEMPHTVLISGLWCLITVVAWDSSEVQTFFKVEVFKPHIVGIVQNITWVTFDFMYQQYHGRKFSNWRGENLGHVFSEDPNTPEKWLWHGVTLSAQRLVKKVRWAVFGCFGRQLFVFDCLIEDDQDEITKSQLVWNSSHSEFCKGVVSERWDRQNLSGWGERMTA